VRSDLEVAASSECLQTGARYFQYPSRRQPRRFQFWTAIAAEIKAHKDDAFVG
jgi:hypothetical protein